MEPRVLSICWLPRGKLAAQPDRINQTGASEERLEALAKAAEAEKLEELSESENSESEEEVEENEEKEKVERKTDGDDVDDLNALGFNMDDYDNEPDDVAANIGSLIIPTSQNEYEFGDGDDEEEAVDVTLKADDHVLLAGNDCPDGTANVEVRIFNLADEFYVRNDIPLDSPPLCLAYVNCEIGEEINSNEKGEYSSNFVAIGCLNGLIQIWDLDILDAPGPAYTLRGHEKSSMVISLASLGDNLISGGSDGKLLVWSLQSGSKIQLGNKSESPVNQCVYVNMKQICSGDANGRLQIFKHKKDTWRRWKSLETGSEIEKICSVEDLIGVGGADGVVRIIKDGHVIAKWAAHSNEPITGLTFNTQFFLFTSGHNVSTSMILWDLRKHQEAGNENRRPLAKYTRVRQKAAGKLFCATICPEINSDLILTGGESGGAQVVKLSRQSKKKQDSDDEDSDAEEEVEDAEKVKDIEEDEWETDTGSSEGEEMDES